jgi:large repetitive protein
MSKRPRLRAHVISPLPVVLGAGILAATPTVVAQPQDDHFEAIRRDMRQRIGNVLANDPPGSIVLHPDDDTGATVPGAGTLFARLGYWGGAGVLEVHPVPCFENYATFNLTYTTNTGTATVYITVVPATRPDAFEVAAGESLDFDVRANDPYQENLLDVVAYSTPVDGSLTQLEPVANSGLFRYQAPPLSGPRAFTYSVQADRIDCGLQDQDVSILVLPNPADDSLSTPHATQACVDVLANDLGGPGLQVVEVGAPSHGGVAEGAAGELCYTPEAGYRGGDSFDYTVQDPHGSTAVASVSVTVLNAPPVANANSASTVAGQSAAGNVLANDGDPNGDSLEVIAHTQPANGSVVVTPDGDFTYTPADGFSGDDAFSYTVGDGFGGEASASVEIAVSPSAQPDALSAVEPTPVAGNVLANDLGTGLVVVDNTQPAHGVAFVDADGTVSYAPVDGFRGKDTFGYTARDNSQRESSASVTITIWSGEVFSAGFESPAPASAPRRPRED